jgi:filamentous hemagglutinin family protein
MIKALLFVMLCGTLFAVPKNPEVVCGTAEFEQHLPDNLLISASDKTIIDWDDFSIQKDEIVSFLQSSESSIVVNRVRGMNPTEISGRLESNGSLWIINPSGIVFEKDSVAEVAGFLASTLDFQNDEFNFGQPHFMGPSQERIIFLGTIKAFSGSIDVLARRIDAEGTLHAENGSVSLLGDEELALEMEEEATFSMKSSTDAPSVLVFECERTLISVNGRVIASGENSGGCILIHAEEIELGENSYLDVSHSAGGGKVLIGFSPVNEVDSTPNIGIIMQKGALIDASSYTEGDGGKVILSSQGVTFFEGEIYALGGQEGGRGGLVKIVGEKFLLFDGRVDVTGLQGMNGSVFTDTHVQLDI